jgi:hypothetical protein
MIPYTLCGIYTLIGCSQPLYIGSELFIDYNTICMSLQTTRYGITTTKNMHGTVRVNDNTANIIWRKSGEYEIDTHVLPLITYPYRNDCKRMVCKFIIEEPWITIMHDNDKYIFRKNIYPKKREDTFLKIFFTQLLLDLIIRHI